jgi:Ca-activated chloride channel family protein
VSRLVRITLLCLGTLLVAALALVYPLLVESQWLHATWRHGWLLLLLPLGLVVAYAATIASEERVPRLTLPALAPLLAGPRGWRTRIRHLPGMLRGAAVMLGVLALGRPEIPMSAEKVEERGIDIVLVLDLSGSMKACMDAPVGATPGSKQPKGNLRPTRLDTAKDVIRDFVSRRKSDRIGVVVFGKSAYVLSPPTLDYALLTQLVSKMEIDLIDGAGTAIGDAVGTAVARLRRSNARSKAIILLTDGDSNAGFIAPEYATHLAQKEGVRVYTVQIGNGDQVDVFTGKYDFFGQPIYERASFPVNPALLKKMAQDTKGDSFVATDRAGLEQSMHAILDQLEKTKMSAQAASNEELFPHLLAPSVALVLLEAIVRVLLVRRFP